MASRRRNATRYPRTARVNELVREIVAEEIERLADERLDLVAVTTVSVEPDLRHAVVYFDSLTGEEGDAEVLAVLGEHRWRLQAAIARQARLKRTPELVFRPDEVERGAERVEGILRDLGDGDEA
ncbi:MAG: 30S ribosome-binding factor RbfA [Acidimicrobiales bacterium]